jgi:hypothetical protein
MGATKNLQFILQKAEPSPASAKGPPILWVGGLRMTSLQRFSGSRKRPNLYFSFRRQYPLR